MWMVEWTTNYILSQIFVLIATILACINYTLKNKKSILTFNIIATLCFALQYAFLNAWTAVVINVIGTGRTIWFYINEKHGKVHDKFSLITVILLGIVAGIFTYENLFSLLPIVANTIFTYGIWQSNIGLYRWLAVATDTSFLIYSIYSKSLLGTIFESALTLFGIINAIKYYINKHKTLKISNKKIDEIN